MTAKNLVEIFAYVLQVYYFIYDFMAFDGSTQLLRIRGIVKYGRAPKISTHFTSLRKVDFIEITGS